MALNNFYIKYTCKLCGHNMTEIPQLTILGEHTFSLLECSNPSCSNMVNDSNDRYKDTVSKEFIRIY